MPDADEKDELYREPGTPAPFSFNEQVARVFPDMIERSVPGYELVVQMSGVIAAGFSRPQCRFYDLGCSTGATSAALLGALPPDGELLALDSSAPMVKRCRANFSAEPRVRVLHQDLLEAKFAPCELAVMNFTLQFIPDAARAPLLARLGRALRPGGGLLLAEKVIPAEADAWHTQTHEDWKGGRGYSRLEVAQKRAALEAVLIRNSLATHRRRLRQAGFGAVIPWFQCLNFIALLALRE